MAVQINNKMCTCAPKIHLYCRLHYSRIWVYLTPRAWFPFWTQPRITSRNALWSTAAITAGVASFTLHCTSFEAITTSLWALQAKENSLKYLYSNAQQYVWPSNCFFFSLLKNQWREKLRSPTFTNLCYSRPHWKYKKFQRASVSCVDKCVPCINYSRIKPISVP